MPFARNLLLRKILQSVHPTQGMFGGHFQSSKNDRPVLGPILEETRSFMPFKSINFGDL